MNSIPLTLSFIAIIISYAVAKVHIDVDELKCLVCKSTIKELIAAVGKIDPASQVDVGGYRLDADGNAKQKRVLKSKSEVHLSELADSICDKMDDYIRATWKSNGKLTILPLFGPNGQMNLDMSEIDIIQDDDLNKSLKYYCERLVEEYEDDIIKQFQKDSQDVELEVCTNASNLCHIGIDAPSLDKPNVNEEL